VDSKYPVFLWRGRFRPGGEFAAWRDRCTQRLSGVSAAGDAALSDQFGGAGVARVAAVETRKTMHGHVLEI